MKARLVWFDLTAGLPVAVGTLRRRIPDRWLRVLGRFMVRSLGPDPFASLSRAETAGERFSRHQLKPVLLLDTVLREDLGLPKDEALEVLGEVVAQSGARFISRNVTIPTVSRWSEWNPAQRRGFAKTVLGRFLNADAELLEDPPGADFGFDVTACHFVGLTRELGRPELAALFCAADSVFFEDPKVPVTLERAQTLASGGEMCPFRFKIADVDGTG